MPKRTKRNPDHVKRHNTPSLDNEVIANQLKALLTPAIAAPKKYYKQLGLRDRVLNLSLMVAVVLTRSMETSSWGTRVNPFIG